MVEIIKSIIVFDERVDISFVCARLAGCDSVGLGLKERMRVGGLDDCQFALSSRFMR